MARECPRCSEPLLGSVNRCWKCGLDLRGEQQPPTSPAKAPPPEVVLVAELADDPSSVATSEPVTAALPTTPLVAPEAGAVELQIDGSTLRRGSPFSTGAVLLPPRAAPSFSAPRSATFTVSLQQRYASEGGMIAALVLGTFGLLISPVRFEGAIVGLLGLLMGIWGLYSTRRGWALFGLILCCLAIGVGGYTGALWLFRVNNQSLPWNY